MYRSVTHRWPWRMRLRLWLHHHMPGKTRREAIAAARNDRLMAGTVCPCFDLPLPAPAAERRELAQALLETALELRALPDTLQRVVIGIFPNDDPDGSQARLWAADRAEWWQDQLPVVVDAIDHWPDERPARVWICPLANFVDHARAHWNDV